MTSWEKNPALGAGAFREMREQQRHLPLLSSKSEFRADVTTLSHEPQAANQGRTADSSASVAGAFATISAARSPARLIMTPWPGKMPPLGAESAVAKPVLRQDSRRLSSGLISSAALRQGVVPGRSCGPREIVWACGTPLRTAGGLPAAPGPPGALGAAVRPRSVSASINPG